MLPRASTNPWPSGLPRQGGEGQTDVLQTEADALGHLDERQPSQHAAGILAMAATRAGGSDQPAILVEAKRRDAYPGAGGDSADRELVLDRHGNLLLTSS